MRFRFFLTTLLFVLTIFDSGCKAAPVTDEPKDVATPAEVTAPSAMVDASASPSVSTDAAISAPAAMAQPSGSSDLIYDATALQAATSHTP